jgi:ubiquinone/menaquinone biosynthesis C-methylase UbiE
MESIFASGEEPSGAISHRFNNLGDFFQLANRIDFPGIGQAIDYGDNAKDPGFSNIESLTGEHYGRLFEAFSASSFWDEPARLLRLRLERNGIYQSQILGKEVLDAGCGGGRYTVAWRLLGARRAIGVDISPSGIESARGRLVDAGMDRVIFEVGNVLKLPFEDNSFDIVFSNGVLHHTPDWKAGVAELVRVLKPGGMGWLYLIEDPGGLFWDVIETLREIMKDEERDFARMALQMLGHPANRIFYMLDHVMVPINLRLRPDEIEGCLVATGATNIRRLSRGADFDRIERIYQGEPYATVKYGVGENRYIFSK